MSSHFWDLANFIGIPDIDIFIETWAFGQSLKQLWNFHGLRKLAAALWVTTSETWDIFHGVSEMYKPFLDIAAFHQLSGA